MSVNLAYTTDVAVRQFTDSGDMGSRVRALLKKNNEVSSRQGWVNVRVADLDAG